MAGDIRPAEIASAPDTNLPAVEERRPRAAADLAAEAGGGAPAPVPTEEPSPNLGEAFGLGGNIEAVS